MSYPTYYDVSRFSDLDIYLFKEGTHTKLYNKLGAHLMQREQSSGVYFALWAPNANAVSLRGDFNHYDINSHHLRKRDDDSGIWEVFIEGVESGSTYKYHIHTDEQNANPDKADPYAFSAELTPGSASRVCSIEDFKWDDKKWMKARKKKNSHKAPISIYEIHLGSWRRKTEESNRYLTYVEAAHELADYLNEMNFTHVELMPITEYPLKAHGVIKLLVILLQLHVLGRHKTLKVL